MVEFATLICDPSIGTLPEEKELQKRRCVQVSVMILTDQYWYNSDGRASYTYIS